MFNWNLLNVFHFTELEKRLRSKQWPKSVGIHHYWGYFFFLSGFSFTDIQDLQDNRGRGSLSFSSTALCHFHLLHRHSEISKAVTAQSSPTYIASSWNWTRNNFFSKCKNFHFILQRNLQLKSHDKLSSLKDELGNLCKRL